METNRETDELLSFFEGYAEFLAHMLKDEEEKLQALLSNSLPRIEHSISVAQANAMQLENLELKRQLLQDREGFSNLPFSGIIKRLPEERRMSYQVLFDQIEKYVNEIKYHNEKSMGVARSNVRSVNPDLLIPVENNQAAEKNPYVRAKMKENRTSILETKI